MWLVLTLCVSSKEDETHKEMRGNVRLQPLEWGRAGAGCWGDNWDHQGGKVILLEQLTLILHTQQRSGCHSAAIELPGAPARRWELYTSNYVQPVSHVHSLSLCHHVFVFGCKCHWRSHSFKERHVTLLLYILSSSIFMADWRWMVDGGEKWQSGGISFKLCQRNLCFS